MKIVKSTVTQIEISDVDGLDSIRVVLDDLGPGRGRINIECWGKSWAAYWGAMGVGSTIAQFFCSCDEHYLASSLSPGLPDSIFDPEFLKDTLKREVITERRRGLTSGGYARERFNTIEELDLPDNIDQLWGVSSLMVELLGDEWWHNLPEKPNPDYTYLCRIIKAVQAALREVQS